MKTVLVTGGTGFIGGHLVLALLKDGYAVRTTVRSLARESEIRTTLRDAGHEPGERLTVLAADLSSDAGWSDAVRGCDFVHHVASPLPIGEPKHEDELIVPARDGTLRVLRAARDAGVKRVVVTSSFAAVGYGHPPQDAPFDEETWTNLNGPQVSAYVKSKATAERAAWDFMAREGGALELAVVNPVAVLGPLLNRDLSGSVELVNSMMDGKMPAVPRIYFGVVDVRDVVDLHLKAMTDPKAKGQRFLAVAGAPVSLRDIARMLGLKTRQLPDWAVRLVALFLPAARSAVPELGKIKGATHDKARRLLGWTPRSTDEAVRATAESLRKLASK